MLCDTGLGWIHIHTHTHTLSLCSHTNTLTHTVHTHSLCSHIHTHTFCSHTNTHTLCTHTHTHTCTHTLSTHRALTKLHIVAPSLTLLHVGGCKALRQVHLRTPKLSQLMANLLFRCVRCAPSGRVLCSLAGFCAAWLGIAGFCAAG